MAPSFYIWLGFTKAEYASVSKLFGIIASLGVCAVLYVAVAAVVTGIVPSPQFANI